MATGAAPGLDPKCENKPDAHEAADAKHVTLTARIIRKLSEIFEHNEELGATRL